MTFIPRPVQIKSPDRLNVQIPDQYPDFARQVVHCKILPSEDDGSLLINGKSYGEKFETLDQIVERLAKEPLLPKWPVQLTEAMGVDGETYVLGAAKKKKKKKKKTTTSETKTATTSEPVPDPDPESASTADASPGSSTVDATPPPPAPTIGSVLVSRESPNIDFGFALGESTYSASFVMPPLHGVLETSMCQCAACGF